MTKNLSLFQIGTEFHALSDLANDEQFDEETGELIDQSEALTALFNEVQQTLGDKLDNTMFVIRNLEFMNSSTQGEIDYLDKILKEKKQKVKYKENKIDFLKSLMSGALSASGKTKLETDKFKFNRTISINVNWFFKSYSIIVSVIFG